VLGPDRIGHQLLSLFQDPLRGLPIIQPRGGDHVGIEHSGPQHIDHPLVSTPCLLVPGWAKRDIPPALIVSHRR
jgi:hypothetical protein